MIFPLERELYYILANERDGDLLITLSLNMVSCTGFLYLTWPVINPGVS